MTQSEMKLPGRYKAEEMGSVMGRHAIFLCSSFINRMLRIGSNEEIIMVGEVTAINCPFCETGSLKLIRVYPEYSGGARHQPSTRHYVGSSYEFRCSNEQCDGRFLGFYTWLRLHID